MRKRPDLAARNRAAGNPELPYRKWPSEWSIWRGMLARCHSPRSKDFGRYGARGIAVCGRWHLFENFFADMGPRPSSTHQIDRIHNDGNYEPANCAWRTPSEQARNRRSSRVIECFGLRKTLVEWATDTGIGRVLIAHRIKAGWPLEEALTKRADRSANHRHRRTKEVCK